MAALDPPGTGPARGASEGGGPPRGSAGELGAPRAPGRQPAARRTAKGVTYPDTRTSGEQRAKHAPNPLRLRAPVTCAGEWGGAGAGEVPVPTSCAAPVAASAQVRGSPEIRLLLPQVSGETESARRGGADINPGAAAPAHAPRAPAGASQPRFRGTCPAAPASPTLPRSLVPEGLSPEAPALGRAPGGCSTLAPPGRGWGVGRGPAPQNSTPSPGGPDAPVRSGT